MDKLGVYEKEDRDSARRKEREQGNVYERLSMNAVADTSAGVLQGQLDKLRTWLRPPGLAGAASPGVEAVRAAPPPSLAHQQLEAMLRRMHQPDTMRADPQLDRLSGMLDKIIKVQHPTAAAIDSSRSAMALELPKSERVVTDLADAAEESGGFFGIDGEEGGDTAARANAFEAIIPEAQVLVAGATVALRLLQEARIGSVIVPRDEMLYGKAALSGDRLQVTINSIRVGHNVYPVALQIYDLDGLAGLHVPGAITRDVLKQSAAEGVGGLGIVSAGPSLGVAASAEASAAEAGIAAARSLMSRKVALVRVTVPAGYRVFLKNNH
jgi:conjugative transposon TraM protein